MPNHNLSTICAALVIALVGCPNKADLSSGTNTSSRIDSSVSEIEPQDGPAQTDGSPPFVPMNMTLIVSRSFDREFNETGVSIERDEWLAVANDDPEIEFAAEPHVAENPAGGIRISVPVGDAETELLLDAKRIPFFRYRNGEIVMEYGGLNEEESRHVRDKVAEIARKLDALIMHDAGDEILDW